MKLDRVSLIFGDVGCSVSVEYSGDKEEYVHKEFHFEKVSKGFALIKKLVAEHLKKPVEEVAE